MKFLGSSVHYFLFVKDLNAKFHHINLLNSAHAYRPITSNILPEIES